MPAGGEVEENKNYEKKVVMGEEKSSSAKCRILFLSPLSLSLRPNEIIQFIPNDIIKNETTRVLLYCYYYVMSFRHIIIVPVHFVLSV